MYIFSPMGAFDPGTLYIELRTYHQEQDEKVKETKAGPLFNEHVPYYLEKLDILAKKNNGHLAVGRLTWADLYFIAMLDSFKIITKKRFPC
ncbi:hypothetical protein NQ318_002402 [Aromia moschata]|uniref:GST C-terminal domain-containing protein n=1 Tax=Aromia moschata TaxID=1265417 RepID=A0AAV8YFN3_9CUCU|nr:hypothetical protein NQ318_002402 [Aromia moschata]